MVLSDTMLHRGSRWCYNLMRCVGGSDLKSTVTDTKILTKDMEFICRRVCIASVLGDIAIALSLKQHQPTRVLNTPKFWTKNAITWQPPWIWQKMNARMPQTNAHASVIRRAFKDTDAVPLRFVLQTYAAFWDEPVCNTNMIEQIWFSWAVLYIRDLAHTYLGNPL